MSKSSHKGLISRTLPAPPQVGLHLDRPINDSDIWLIQIGERRMVKTKSSCEGMTGEGRVLMRFIGKSGSNVERFNN